MENIKCGAVGKVQRMESTNAVCGMRCVGEEKERGVNGGMKKWVGRWMKEKIPSTESGCETDSPSCKENGGPAMGRAIGE